MLTSRRCDGGARLVLRVRDRAPAAAQRCSRRAPVCAAATATSLRVLRTHELGATLPSTTFRLAPTDSSAPGNCIAWSLFFDVCPEPERVATALEALLSAYPVFTARAGGASRWEVASTRGAGVPLEVCAWDGVASVSELLDAALGFVGAPLTPRAARALPFLVLPNAEAMDAGDAPLLALRLTRLPCGGGVLAATFSHALTDGQRCAVLLADLARAARGETLPAAAADDGRSRLWPEELLALPSVAAALAAPRAPEAAAAEAAPAAAPPPPSHAEPPQSWALLPLHIPAGTVEALVARVRELAPSGLVPSRHDAAAGLVWALRCAASGVPLPGEAGAGRFIIALDLASNGLPLDVLPPRWSGNAAAALSVDPPAPAGGGHGALPAVAAAASAIRAALTAYRSEPRRAVEHVLSAASRSGGRWAAAGASAAPLVGFATSCLHLRLDALDCGTGAPAALHYSTLPLRSPAGLLFSSIAPGPRGDGILLLLAASDAHARALLDPSAPAGTLLAEAAPGARFLRREGREDGL